MKRGGPRILYGVCGIGLGHLYRQLPVIERCSRICERLAIFAYGRSHEYLARRFAGHESVRVEAVQVPFYAGGPVGLDFAASLSRASGGDSNLFETNCRAMDAACRFLGHPDIAISDYEPVSAQLAYAHGAPLVTIDQQSKYLLRSEWPLIDGLGCLDETMRLRMFFPRAELRIASSFFRVPAKDPLESVRIVGPVVREEILRLARSHDGGSGSVLVYLSPHQDTAQTREELFAILAGERGRDFDVFTAEGLAPTGEPPGNVRMFRHGDPAFTERLARSAALITTAGHSLLSEAMLLAIPVYALPSPVYEQRANAEIIGRHGFGVASATLEPERLSSFLEKLPEHRRLIVEDREVLIREPGQVEIFELLEPWLGRS